ncbi:AbfB domain-containing protein [Actinoplanes teichomyceticus]|uniref:Alpha-L-arabinofuranosidase B-like protein n=1 Tax=Actinoplanes teichomyceticus TaxID=1867 RepID=A0A561WAI5_ACTTI|nr:AbfB domain-containing protein [Actinoplanes teichomyceticus]TWG20874.1 alpha-L-arabinofuranosidase B-like protein [Actinoplanes teichomyceticus]GIF14535.1 hypothetical protein Ate01nite_45670 [Actinoplanes teichomyceticus]
MPEDDTRSRLRVGGWVPPYSPDARCSAPRVGPTTPATFSPAPPPGFPGWSRRGGPLRRRAALTAVAVATLAVAALSAAALRGDPPPGDPAFVAGAVPPAPPPAQPVIIAPSSSSTPAPTGSAPTSRPAATPASHRRTSKPTRAWPAPSRATALTLRAGSTVALTLADDPGQRVRHRDLLGRIDAVGPSPGGIDRADSSFTVRAGLGNSGCVSFESVNFPGYFLRHENFIIKLHRPDGSQLFRQDATFCPIRIRSGAALALRSLNFPERFVAAFRGELRLRESAAGTALALVPRAVG